MSSELLRYEINRKIRQVLVSHNADMTKISYSFVHRTVYMSGNLVRESQGEFSLPVIEGMIRELMKLPRVQKILFDLENWIISNEPGALNIVKKKGLGQHPAIKDLV
ncbi:MAG TPA: hypothetical protein PK424_06780 [Smithella sp.]|nr:hypothetical protein [Smithella sp.]